MIWRLIKISWRSRHPVLAGIGAAVGAAIGFAIFSNLYGFTMPTHPRRRHCHLSKHYHRQLRFKGHRTRSSFRVRPSQRGTNPSQWRWTSWAGYPKWQTFSATTSQPSASVQTGLSDGWSVATSDERPLGLHHSRNRPSLDFASLFRTFKTRRFRATRVGVRIRSQMSNNAFVEAIKQRATMLSSPFGFGVPAH
jgi:hypothetical protein